MLLIALVFVLGTGTVASTSRWPSSRGCRTRASSRGEVARRQGQEYVLAARAAGFTDARILGRHILPNVITQSIVYAMSDIVVIILGIVTLSYLGVGVPPPTPGLGRDDLRRPDLPHDASLAASTIPGFAVVFTGLGLSLLGDGLADLLRPE